MTPDTDRFDVAIVGGGINGASAAQHLAAAGYSVFLADRDDFANGASARSSRLLHCGLRHLANGSSPADILRNPGRLLTSLNTVRDDMVARDEIVRSIPGRVKPMTFCLPLYRQDIYRPWHMDLAFAALRMASMRGVPLDYRRYRAGATDMPTLARHLRDPDELAGMVSFREYIFDWPERIALDALTDAERLGADLRNYTEVTRLSRQKKCWQITLETGEVVSSSLVLNLAGAWVDGVSASAGSNAPARCQPISGIHIALKLPGEFEGHGVFAFNRLGEPLYCLPWRGHHYVGLTRLRYSGDPLGISASDEEIDWLLSETNHCFPGLHLAQNDVLYTWAGVNPLTLDPTEPLGSREIKIHDHRSDGLPGFLSLTGGPIMTHRRVARRLVKRVESILPPSRAVGTPIYEPQVASGDEAILQAVKEKPVSLADLMMRRLGLAWDPDQGLSAARHVAEIAAPELGWDKDRIDREIEAYELRLKTERRQPADKQTGEFE